MSQSRLQQARGHGTSRIMGFLRDLWLCRRPLMVFLALGILWGGLAALVPPIKARLGASDGLYGTLMLAATCGSILAVWVAPLAERRLGGHAMMLFAFVMAAGFALVGQTTGPYGFVTALFFAALGTGTADVLANAEISEIETRTGKALMNLNHAAFSMTFAASAATTGLMRDAGWGPPLAMGLLAAVAAGLVPLMRFGQPPARTSQSPSGPVGLPPVLIALAGLIVLAGFLVESASEGWSALHLERTLGASPTEGALGPALFGGMMALGRFAGHFLPRRVPDLLVMGLASALAAAGFALISAATAIAPAYLGFALAGLGISVIAPLAFGLVGRVVREEQRLPAISQVAAMGYGAFFVGPPAIGALAELYGLPMAFATIAAVLLAVAVLLVPGLSASIRAFSDRK